MPDLLSAAEFEQRIQQVSRHLDSLRAGRPAPVGGAAWPYAGLDLSAELSDLAPILATLLHQDPDEIHPAHARIQVGARRLALAALSALAHGGEGLADFSSRYETLMGQEPEYALFERVLPAALREAGLPAPAKQDSHHLLEALLLGCGMPQALVLPATEYFVTYWRYFHPLIEPLSPLAFPDETHLSEPQRLALVALAARLLPNAAVVGPWINGLATIMEFLRTQSKWRAGDLFSQSDAIWQGCGIAPRPLLANNQAALALLSGELSHAWHPEQLRHVITGLHRGGEVRLPNGALALAEKVVGLHFWGVYRVDGVNYLVLPNEGLTLEEVKALGENQFHVEGNRALWKGQEKAECRVDGWPQIVAPLPLYEERQALGWFYYNTLPQARTLEVGHATLAPRAGTHGRFSLIATVEGTETPRLFAQMAGMRVCLPEMEASTLQLECPDAETAGRLTFQLDERGVGGLPDSLLALAEPKPGRLEAFLQDHATGQMVERGGKSVIYRLPLPEVMLFSEATGMAIAPRPEAYWYGLPSYLLFSSRPVNTEALELLDIGVTSLGRSGAYEVWRLTWNQPEQQMSIYLDQQYGWTFSYMVDTVWQTGELAQPMAPLAFAPETPVGYVVGSPDDLYVDDVSWVQNPLVTLSKDGISLLATPWEDLNWMMNFEPDNRRFSGVMLRRMLHVGPEFDLAGHYRLGLKASGELLGERQITILPALSVTIAPLGPQSEDTSFTLTARSSSPCFEGGAYEMTVPLGSAIVDRNAMESSPFQPQPLEKTVPLQVPLFDLPIALIPDVIGFRLLDEREGTWIRKTLLNYDELNHITLVLFASHGRKGTLKVGDGPALQEDFYEGFATFPLASLQGTLDGHETAVRVAVDGMPVGELQILWHLRLAHFELANEYMVEQAAQLEIQVEGPEAVPVRLEAYAPNGRQIGEMEVRAEGGTLQRVAFHLPASRDYPVVSIKAFVPTEQSGVASGTLEVRNAAFEPEIEEMNRRVASNPHEAQLRFQRAQLLVERGLRKAASRDFQAAIELGMTELKDSAQYQQFMTQRQAESFLEDLKALASFFVPFARKELNLG